MFVKIDNQDMDAFKVEKLINGGVIYVRQDFGATYVRDNANSM